MIFDDSYLSNGRHNLATELKDVPYSLNFLTRNYRVVESIASTTNCTDFNNDQRYACVNDKFDNKTFTIDSSTNVFTFEGSATTYTIARNVHMQIAERTTPLTIYLKNFNTINGYSGDTYEPFIKYLGSSFFVLNIQYIGENCFNYFDGYVRAYLEDKPAFSLYGARVNFKCLEEGSSLFIRAANGKNGAAGNKGNDGTTSSPNGKNGSEGQGGACGCTGVAAHVVDITEAKNLTIRGGDGGDGGVGGTGGKGANGTSSWQSNGTNGGRGGNGGPGGPGGYGGLPLDCNRIVAPDNKRPATVWLLPGASGRGGQGGSGGTGGNGGDGAAAKTHEERYMLFFKKTVVDAVYNGGNGGNGGDGGPAGQPFKNPFYSENRYGGYFTNCSLTNKDNHQGWCGNGGAGGAGGSEGGSRGADGSRGNGPRAY